MGCFLYFLSFIWVYKCLLTCCNCVKPKGEDMDDSDDENDDMFWDSSNQSSPKDPGAGGGGGGGGGAGFGSAESQALSVRQPGLTYGGTSRGPAAYVPPRNVPSSGVLPYQSPGKSHKNFFVKKGHKVSKSGAVDGASEFRVGGEFGAAVNFTARQRKGAGGGAGGVVKL